MVYYKNIGLISLKLNQFHVIIIALRNLEFLIHDAIKALQKA